MSKAGKQLLFVAAMAGLISVVFFLFYEEAIREGAPIHYAGDALVILAQIQAAKEGSFPLGLPKMVERLNAPEEAWWSDFPLSDLIFWVPGQVAKLIGVFMAANLAVLASLVLAGGAFYGVSCALGMRPLWAATFGVLFALSPYAFVRQLEYLILTVYFVVPVILWIAWRLHRCVDFGEDIARKEAWVLFGLSFVCGLFNPYYLAALFLFLGFLGLGALYGKKWKPFGWSVAIGIMAFLGFLLQNMDYFLQQVQHGANPAAISRDLWWMVKFGLYLPDMVLPKFHHSEWIRFIGGKDYHFQIPEVLAGESQTAYIGAMALMGLAGMVLVNFGIMFGGSPKKLDPLFLFALVLFLFAVVGGLNYLAGAFGFQLFRASNRYSIFFMAIGLLVAGLFFTRFVPPKWWSVVPATALLAFGLWDQIPAIPDWQRQEKLQAAARFRKDRIFFPQMESVLPVGGMVFQLPVHFFPEMGQVHEMDDYEHFRPYLHTKTLRFSYGTVKGRQHMLWQMKLDFFGRSEESLRTLEERGFVAILLNRRAYPDGGENQANLIKAAGWKLLMQSSDFMLFKAEDVLSEAVCKSAEAQLPKAKK